jgi:hypothetical protein
VRIALAKNGAAVLAVLLERVPNARAVGS